MALLEKLHAKLLELEKPFAESPSKLNGVSFDLSYNDSYGLSPDNPEDFIVFHPYRRWEAGADGKVANLSEAGLKKYPSALQEAFIDVIKAGKVDKKTCFIDITSLEPHPEFFTEGVASSVAQELVNFVEANPSQTPVIRFLFGTSGPVNWEEEKKKIEQIFWRNNTPLLKKDSNAKIYVGYYRPDFQTKSSSLGTLITALTKLPLLGSTFVSVSKVLFDNPLPTISWNHSKIVAVNGKTAMTGGGNCWIYYTATYERSNSIVDHQAKIKGGAAVSAHMYADYFWKYLNHLKSYPEDSQSVSHSINLDAKGDKLAWGTDPAPLAVDEKFDRPASGKPVLTTSKLGDWHGDMLKIDYPIQIIDCLRDIYMNVEWQKMARSTEREQGADIYSAYGWLKDDTFLFGGLLNKLSINPNAWASRTARNVAIEQAQSSIYISQQMLVDYLQSGSQEFKNLRDKINSATGLTAKKLDWEGWIWPYDLLIELAKALVRIKANKGKGIDILLSTSIRSKKQWLVDWEDQVPIWEIKRRLRIILKGLELVAENEVEALMGQYLHIRRILKNDGEKFCHTKVVCVDDELMYVGSDNAYPAYHEEHGVWIQDKATVEAWKTKFWNAAWSGSDLGTDNTQGYLVLEQQENKKDGKPVIEFIEKKVTKEVMEALNKKA